eukprot:g289.t1
MERQYKLAIEAKPTESELHFRLGALYNYRCNMSAAKASYNRALVLNPLHAGSYFELGKVALSRREDNAAEEHLKQAARLAPDFRQLELNHYLAELLFHRNRDAEAEGYYRTALSFATVNDARLHVNLALALANQGRAAEASEVCLAYASKGSGIGGSAEIEWTAPHRFQHDIEQMEYLQGIHAEGRGGRLVSSFDGEGVHSKMDWAATIGQYRSVQADVAQRLSQELKALSAENSFEFTWPWSGGRAEDEDEVEGGLVELSAAQLQELRRTYNRLWHLPNSSASGSSDSSSESSESSSTSSSAESGKDDEREASAPTPAAAAAAAAEAEAEAEAVPVPVSMLHPSLSAGSDEVARIEREYAEHNVTVIDSLLTDEALETLYNLCLETPMWHEVKPWGYLGAYMDTGLADPALFQLAHELRERFPGIFRESHLRRMWAYKYSQGTKGIDIHGDDAEVNVNLWLTPTDAMEDSGTDGEQTAAEESTGGGLVVFKQPAPLEWSFDDFNEKEKLEPGGAIDTLLKSTDFANVTVPYKQNRVVLFSSHLFHKTDAFRFKKGYKNRRINLTFLFGNRHGMQEPVIQACVAR